MECPRKAFLESQHFAIQQTKSLVIKKAMMEAIAEEGFWNIADKYSMDKHFQTIDEKYFQLKKEKELELDIIAVQLKRMLNYMRVMGFKFLGSEVKGEVAYTDYFMGVPINEPLTLRKKFDLVLENEDIIYVAKLSRRAPELTMRAGTKNYAGNSVELFMMQTIGEAIYPGKIVVPAIISLIRKDENSFTTLQKFDENAFEAKVGQNIFSFHFDYAPHEMLLQIASMANMKIDYKSERNCKNCGECEYEKICGYDNSDDVKLEKLSNQEKTVGTPKFTPAQLDIVTFGEGNARVLAGAGSGKTTVLINRVIYLLSEQPDLKPSDFLMITFTEKGVREMKEKLIYWLMKEGYAEDEAAKFEVNTFNGFGQKILNENYKCLGFATQPRLIERIEQIDIIKEILEQFPILQNYNYRNPLLEMFRAKGVILDLAETILKMKEKNIPSLAQFKVSFPVKEIGREITKGGYFFDYDTCYAMYLKYREALKERNLIDYSDQLNLTLEILEKHDVSEQYAYKHIVLDEFQDTSLEQLLMIKRIRDNSGKVESMLVCGDDAQAIFSFRGVGLENILEFPVHFPGCHNFFMVDNFRSSRQIVDLANDVIEFSPHNLKKSLISKREGDVPKFILTDSSLEFIAKSIQQNIAQGIKAEDIAVVARTRTEISAINNLLKRKGIPSIMSVSERLIDNQRIIGIISLARFLDDNDDSESLMQWLEISDYQAFINEADLSKYVGIQKQIILDEIKGLNDIQLLSWFKLKIYQLGCQDRAVDKLASIVEGFSDMKSAHNFLNKMELYRSEISVELDDVAYKAVTLTTVHSAKGREFKHVYVAYDKFKAENGRQKGGTTAPKDEEVRLLFVAITRAMNQLTIVSEETSNIFSRDVKLIDWINLKKES